MKLSTSREDRPILEATLEGAEVIADVLMKGEVIAEIPIIGTAFKLCKAVDSVRDRAFIAKLDAFISGLGAMPNTAKEQMRNRVNSSPEEAKRIGETLFLILERVIDLDKPTLLSSVFLAYLKEMISADDLRRMAQAIDASFFNDLQQFITAETLPEKSDAEWMQYLATAGLTRPVANPTYDDIGVGNYEPTPVGKKLHEALRQLRTYG